MSGGRVVAVPSASLERIARRHERLATFAEPTRPNTRRAFTDVYAEARRWLAEEFRSEGLACALDAATKLVGRTGDGARPAMVLGSHVDTVVGGRYDGMAGVVCALEVASVVREAGIALRHPLEVVDFLSEEPSDYGASCIGSSAMAGTLTARILEGQNPDGGTLYEAIVRVGGRPETVGRWAADPNAANVVPERAGLALEARSFEEASLDGIHAAMSALAESFAERAGATVDVELVSTAAAACDPMVRGALLEAAKRWGIGFAEPYSGAGHDAMQMALVAPMGMLFVPSRDGVSHAPEEHTDVADLAAGAPVPCSAVLALDEGTGVDPSEGRQS